MRTDPLSWFERISKKAEREASSASSFDVSDRVVLIIHSQKSKTTIFTPELLALVTGAVAAAVASVFVYFWQSPYDQLMPLFQFFLVELS